MDRFLGLLSAVGILLAIWAVLTGAAFLVGVLPPLPAAAGTDDEAGAVAADGSTTAMAGQAGPGPNASTDAGPSGDSGGPSEPTTDPSGAAVQPFLACGGAGGTPGRPTLTAVQISGDARPELLLGCGGRFELLHVGRGSADGQDAMTPVRLAVFEGQAQDGEQRVEAGLPAVGDVDGDSLLDLVLPLNYMTADGATRGGELHLVRGDTTGAFEAPRRLAPIAAVEVALAELDGNGGLDIVVMNRTSALAHRRSEVWVFGGGAAPSRTAVLRTGLDGTSIAVADVDRDGHQDVVSVVSAAPHVDLFMGDGSAHFPRTMAVAVAGSSQAIAADLDGDARAEVLVQANGIHLLKLAPTGLVEPTPIDAPPGLSDIAVLDVDGDGHADIVGIGSRQIIWMRQTGPLTFEAASLLSIAGMNPVAWAVADFDASGKTDLAVLARSDGDGGPWTLAIVPRIAATGEARLLDEARAIADAPLTLRIALP